MATSGAATIMADTQASDYYRRSGLDSVTVRGRPGVKRRANIYQVQTYDLDIDEMLEVIVYPELTVRSKPWEFWGKVVRFYNEAVVFRQMAGDQTGTIVRIPYRYFEDGRVYRKDLSSDE